jgi:hypothetical protein
MNFTDNLDLMVQYIRHIIPSSEPCDLHEGTIEQRIDKIQAHVRTLVSQFQLSDEERRSFHLVLEYEKQLVTIGSRIWCLAKCVDKLASYSNLSKEEKELFFA